MWVVCETVRKRIPPNLVRTASVQKLNSKCEKTGWKWKDIRGKNTSNKKHLCYVLSQIQLQPAKIPPQLKQHTGEWKAGGCLGFWGLFLNSLVTSSAKYMPQFTTQLPLPWTKMFHVFLWKRANLTPIYRHKNFKILKVLLYSFIRNTFSLVCI